MTSTDLANEQTKQEIVNAQKESLKQTILVETKAVPLAKRTHKGEEIIESFGQEIVRQNKEDDEKRERERMLRLRMPPPPLSGAGGPISGISEGSPAEFSPNREPFSTESLMSQSSVSRPLFLTSASDFTPLEPTLDLSDLIDIDLPDSPKEPGSASASKSPPPTLQNITLPPTPSLIEIPPELPSTPATSIPEPLRRTSFDLNALWSSTTSEKREPPAADVDNDMSAENTVLSPTSISIEGPITKRADDGDFDMLLEEDPIEAIIDAGSSKSLAERQAEVYAALPPIWSGTVSAQFHLLKTS
jgi:hypothetical protein